MHVKTYGKLTVQAVKVFGDTGRAEKWLSSPTHLLDGQTPLEAMKTSEGEAKVQKQLERFAGHPPQTH